MKNNIKLGYFLRFVLFLTFSISVSVVLAASKCDTLYLKNGGFLVGEVLKITTNKILIQGCNSSGDDSFWLNREELKGDFPLAPEGTQLSLGGPRMGLVFFSGNIAERIKDPSSKGGLNAKPVMSQFGYQFETAYISGDKVQVLFEFVPNISGLDQGKFLPTLSVLNGVRHNKTGWEIILGPVLHVTKRAEGFYDESNQWTLLSDWEAKNPGVPNPDNVEKGFDTRGDFGVTTSFLLAVGKNFHSGDVNFPINIYAVPHPEGVRFGLSVGFNKMR